MPLSAALAAPHGASIDKVVKSYRKLVQKLYHLDDLNAEAARPRKLAIAKFQAARLQTRISLNSALEKLQSVVINTDLRALWHASRKTARTYWEQQGGEISAGIRSKGTPPPAPSTAKALEQEKLVHLTGTNDLFRVAWLFFISKTAEMWMNTLNTTHVRGAEVMEMAMQRPKGQPLITVCNHVGALDDPLIITSILPGKYHADPAAMRWSLCATDRCFKMKSMIPLFRAAKILPVSRGGGMAQEGMQAAEHQLNQGDWVHIFPEGTRSRDPSQLGPIRKGVGRLVACTEEPPLVIPFVHTGMEKIQPRGKAIPAMGQEVKVIVGQPIPVADLLESGKTLNWSTDQLYTAIAQRVSQHLHALHGQLNGTLPESVSHEISPLDLYDPADLSEYQKASLWEKLRFKMEHRAWAMHQWVSAKANRYMEARNQLLSGEQGYLVQQDRVVPDRLAVQAATMDVPEAQGSSSHFMGGAFLSMMSAVEARKAVERYTAVRTSTVAGLLSTA